MAGDLVRRLPAGATTFSDGAVPADADPAPFLALCHHAARRTGGSVREHRRDDVVRSFHEVVLDHRSDGQVAVLRHRVLPVLAFARPRAAGDVRLTFVDHPPLAAAFAEAGDLGVATVAELSVPLSRVDLRELGAVERRQLAYWDPGTVGEVLFNFWD